MKKRKKGPDVESPEEMRRKFFIGAGIVTVGIIIAFFMITKVVPKAYHIIMGETSFAGQSTSYWATALAGKNPDVKWLDAAVTLKNGGDKAVPVLAQVLKSEDATARSRSAKVLALIGSKDAVPALKEAQKDPDRDVRSWSAYGLAKIAPTEGVAIPALLEAALLQDKDVPNLAENVDKLLDQVPPPVRMAGYLEAFKNPTLEVRFRAVQEMGELGAQGKDSAPALIGLLRDRMLDKEGYSMADRAATALGLVNPEARTDAVQQFLKELQDRDADRAGAAYALGRLRGAAKPAIPALKKLLKDKDQNVAKEAHNAIEAIDPKAVDD